jgi:hypothetical protein
MGNRLPEDMKEQFRNMVQTGVTVPSLSHYVKYAAVLCLRIEYPSLLGWPDFEPDT